MEYRYYIYRQSLIPTNFNKYDLTQYDYVREITNNGQWGLNIDRNSDWFTVIRKEFNGTITVSGQDYDAMIGFEGLPYQYAIVIHRKCNGAYSEFWKGYFSYFDYKVDMDACRIEFTPTVWDKYSAIMDQMDIERNALAAGDIVNVGCDKHEYDIEDFSTSETVNTYGWVDISWTEYFGSGYPAGNKFYAYSLEATWLYYDESITADWYSVFKTYRREYLLSSSSIPTGNWVLDPLLPGVPGESDPGEVSPGVYKWVRPYLDMTAGTAVYSSTVSGKDVLQIMTNSVGGADYLCGGLYLNTVLEYFATFFNLDYESSLFKDDPCPLGISSLNRTIIDHVSNLRGVSEVATKGMIKLKDLLEWIRDTFNAYWYVDAAGDFRIEHRRYFDFGLSYTYSLTVAVDITTLYPTNAEWSKRYEWKKPKLVRFEKLDLLFSYLTDWIDPYIEYPQLSIYTNDSDIKSVQWGTDIIGILDAKEDLPKKGWVLLDTILVTSPKYTLKVRNDIGDYSGQSIPNARFSRANIMRYFWGFGRLLPSGYVNGKPVDFNTVERLKQQTQLTIPQCCTDIDYNGIFRTPLGDGIIDKAEYEAKSGNLQINLIYE